MNSCWRSTHRLCAVDRRLSLCDSFGCHSCLDGPAFGVKQTVYLVACRPVVQAKVEGIYFGQCSELCGKDHTYMPITVKVVSQDIYEDWLDRAREEYAEAPLDDSFMVASR